MQCGISNIKTTFSFHLKKESRILIYKKKKKKYQFKNILWHFVMQKRILFLCMHSMRWYRLFISIHILLSYSHVNFHLFCFFLLHLLECIFIPLFLSLSLFFHVQPIYKWMYYNRSHEIESFLFLTYIFYLCSLARSFICQKGWKYLFGILKFIL